MTKTPVVEPPHLLKLRSVRSGNSFWTGKPVGPWMNTSSSSSSSTPFLSSLIAVVCSGLWIELLIHLLMRAMFVDASCILLFVRARQLLGTHAEVAKVTVSFEWELKIAVPLFKISHGKRFITFDNQKRK